MNRKSLVLLLAMLSMMPALAQVTPDISIVGAVTAAIDNAAANLIMPKAIAWLSALVGLQFVLTNFGLLKSGADIEAIFGKLIGSLAWFSFCFFLLTNGPDFINSVGISLLNTFAPNLPGPGSIITATLALCSTLLAAIAITGTSVVGTGNSAVANVLILVLLTVFSVGMFMAVKILMLTLELALVVMLSPLSFSLLGLNALKDQGIAPLKSLISLAYRIILMGILCAAFSQVAATAGVQLSSIKWANPTEWGDALKIILSSLAAYPIIAYFIYKSDSIAATLASGTTNMGTADVASAAAIGAAAGAAATTGGASLATGAGAAKQSMGDWMSSKMGSASQISNASNRGLGPAPVGPAPQNPKLSLPSGSGANRPPKRSDFEMPATQTGAGSSPTSGGSAPRMPASQPAEDYAATSSKSAPGGSDQNASIGGSNVGGSNSDLEKKLENLTDAMSSQGKKGFKDRAKDVNDHIAREQATTHISVNTHNSD